MLKLFLNTVLFMQTCHGVVNHPLDNEPLSHRKDVSEEVTVEWKFVEDIIIFRVSRFKMEYYPAYTSNVSSGHVSTDIAFNTLYQEILCYFANFMITVSHAFAPYISSLVRHDV